MQSEKELTTRYLTINMGPQHPATHGVLRLVLELDGETVVGCTPHIGYLHRGMEKHGENLTYAAALPLVDRLDYVSAMANEVGYCIAVEKLLGISVPERAKYIRTLVCEMARICSHILWIATHALDIGAMTVFLYSMREREWLLDLFEMICGARLLCIYPRIGGVRCDVSKEVLDSLFAFTESFPKKIEEYETLIDQNRIWFQRTKGIGVISAEEAINWGLTGPPLRGSGVNYDIRKIAPYDAYDKVDFDVPLGKNCDTYDRYRCRMEEFRQSNRIIRQCIDKLPEGFVLSPEAPGFDMQAGPLKKTEPQADVAGTPFSEVYCATETPKGELGFYMISDGTGKPYRMRIRTPSFTHAAAISKLCKGHLVADVVAIIGTTDLVLGECDR